MRVGHAAMLFAAVVIPSSNGRQGRGIIVLHQKLLMSVEEQEEQIDLTYHSLKIRNQNTTTYLKQKSPPENSPAVDFDAPSLDCSFQKGIHQQNIEALQNAVNKYLEACLEGDFNRDEGFRDPGLYENLPFEVYGVHELEELTIHNELLTQREQQELMEMLAQEEDLMGLLREAAAVFGITVGKEVVLAVYHLLRNKLKAFQTVIKPKETIIPRFDCFFGFEEQETTLSSACPIYEDINLEEVGAFAERELDDLSSMLYFSCQLKYLNLRQSKIPRSEDIMPKFKTLIRQLSRSIFYTLAGAIDTVSLSGCSLDLSRQVSFSEFSQGIAVRRSMSRPFVPCEQENLDFMSKRRKFE